ncbi:hypothetical protein [Atopobium deltae]|uniref:Uncharacterized protein n=1 Tax=Atopobium deltae TaxID=1393034 RepID=A0A133XPD4_9ACTN|nr:hypothetical protein [Atopobium deltae]KXB32793.1 hypothetical protein HMPREF3192_01473 [Atopobium deltae]
MIETNKELICKIELHSANLEILTERIASTLKELHALERAISELKEGFGEVTFSTSQTKQ